MGKVMNNVGFTTRKQDLQNTTKRELTDDEKMSIRKSLGLYGEYTQMMMSGGFTGFSDYRPPLPGMWVARFNDLSALPEEAQDFFGNVLPKLFEENKEDWLSGKNMPVYEVDCDGEKTIYPIQVGSGGITFGEPEQVDYDNFNGASILWRYNADPAKISVSINTLLPGTAHKITLTDVTPGRVNQIPSKYLPSALVVELLDITPPSDDHSYYTAKISDEDLFKINANPTANFLLKYTVNDGMENAYFSPLLIGVSNSSSDRGVTRIVTIMGGGSDSGNLTIIPLIIDTIGA